MVRFIWSPVALTYREWTDYRSGLNVTWMKLKYITSPANTSAWVNLQWWLFDSENNNSHHPPLPKDIINVILLLGLSMAEITYFNVTPNLTMGLSFDTEELTLQSNRTEQSLKRNWKSKVRSGPRSLTRANLQIIPSVPRDTSGKDSVIPFFARFLSYPVLRPTRVPFMDKGRCHIASRMCWRWQQIMRSHTCNTSFSACRPTTCSHTNLLQPLPPPLAATHISHGDKLILTFVGGGVKVRGDGHMWLGAKVVIAADKESAPLWILATSETRNLWGKKKKNEVEQWLDSVRHKTGSIEKGALLKRGCLINLSPSTFHMIS